MRNTARFTQRLHAAEAAAVALILLSDSATYVTGSQYAVDGGRTER